MRHSKRVLLRGDAVPQPKTLAALAEQNIKRIRLATSSMPLGTFPFTEALPTLKGKAVLRRLRRTVYRIASRRLAKRGVVRGETYRTLSPVVLPTKTLPTSFDVSAVRTVIGKN